MSLADNLSTNFSVITARRPAEFVHATVDWSVPRTMARLSGGQAVAPSRALSLWNQFGEGSGAVVDRVETNLWDSPWLFLAVLLFGEDGDQRENQDAGQEQAEQALQHGKVPPS